MADPRLTVGLSATAPQPTFFYDLASPACYLAAERVMSELPVVPEWEPVMGSAGATAGDGLDRRAVERRASELGLQPLRWPARWPPDSRQAMLAATYAKHIGRAVAFSLACFRQVFAAGRDLGELDTVVIAAAACEMHPIAVRKAISLRSVVHGLEGASQRAGAAGVSRLPAIEVLGQLFEGEEAVEGVARALEQLG